MEYVLRCLLSVFIVRETHTHQLNSLAVGGGAVLVVFQARDHTRDKTQRFHIQMSTLRGHTLEIIMNRSRCLSFGEICYYYSKIFVFIEDSLFVLDPLFG